MIRLYGKKPELPRHLKPLQEQRAEMEKVAKANEAAFERATRQLFQTLYHEAFHAYVGNFVYPPAGKDHPDCPGELPRWLNEGMAQVFETAIFEAGELRIGHADRSPAGEGPRPVGEEGVPAAQGRADGQAGRVRGQPRRQAAGRGPGVRGDLGRWPRT